MVMRSLIATAALLASVSASAGELDGKAILCLRSDAPELSPYGYEFRDGKIFTHRVITVDNGKKAQVTDYSSEYTAAVDTVFWNDDFNKLDRKTLMLTVYGKMTLDVLFTRQCEVSDSVGAMKQVIETHRQKTQGLIDEQMQGNKI